MPRRRPLALQLDDAAPGRWTCDCLECLVQALDVIARHKIPQRRDDNGDANPSWSEI